MWFPNLESQHYWQAAGHAEIYAAAVEMFGEPNREHSTPEDLRFGTRGSKSVALTGAKRGQWYDHEEGKGGYLPVAHDDLAKHLGVAGKPVALGRGTGPSPHSAAEATGAASDAQGGTGEREARARALWERCVQIPGTIAQTYLEARAINTRVPPDRVAFHPSALDGKPCCVFRVTDRAGETVAVQRVPLLADGSDRDRSLGKKSLGPIGSGFFELSDPDPKIDLVTEGPEDALAVWCALKEHGGAPSLRVVAMCGQRWRQAADAFPGAVFIADSDSVVAASAAAISCQGRVLNPSPHKDANDLLIAEGPFALAERLRKAPRAKGEKTAEACGASPRPRLWLRDAAPVLENLDAVKGWLPRRGIATLYGPPGAGKTWLALDMAAHIAARVPWHGLRVKGGAVVYVAFEGTAGMQNRLVPLRARVGDAPLVVLQGGVDLCDPASVAALIAEIRDIEKVIDEPVAQVWIDTLARAMGGQDENAPDGMGRALAGASRIEAAIGGLIVLVHHTGKDTSRGARGHSSLKAAVDAEIEVARDDDIIIATASKQRNGADGATFCFRLQTVPLGLDRDGEAVTTCVVAPLDADELAKVDDPKGAKPSRVQQAVLEALEQFVNDQGKGAEGEAGSPTTRGAGAVEIDEFLKFAVDRGVSQARTPGDQRKVIRRVIEELVRAGRVRREDTRISVLF
ncbi:AAA family ATPase [Limibaculum sp. FT325]|uniref:AAA family ATPase n=1 Tax=Thermohalobaculum sediminis TaxID=2939436 RepID=UPI0020C16AB5|nr:AAA family ATPase [Limibaculum sediminis]MCL5779093.1 AAA family ATPase [Limibaculum sediminis]